MLPQWQRLLQLVTRPSIYWCMLGPMAVELMSFNSIPCS